MRNEKTVVEKFPHGDGAKEATDLLACVYCK